MPLAPCWRDAEQQKANQRLGSKDPRLISYERREWEKERWFCAITGKPVLLLHCLCWCFGVWKIIHLSGRKKSQKPVQKPLTSRNVMRLWRGVTNLFHHKIDSLQDSPQWFLQEQKGKLGCLVLRIAETSVCCEMTKRDVSGTFTLRNKTETLSLRPYQISVLWYS